MPTPIMGPPPTNLLVMNLLVMNLLVMNLLVMMPPRATVKTAIVTSRRTA